MTNAARGTRRARFLLAQKTADVCWRFNCWVVVRISPHVCCVSVRVDPCFTTEMKTIIFSILKHALERCCRRDIPTWNVSLERIAVVEHGVEICHSGDVPPCNVRVEHLVVLEHIFHRSYCANVPVFHSGAHAMGTSIDRSLEFTGGWERPSDDEINGVHKQREADDHTWCLKHSRRCIDNLTIDDERRL